MVLLLSEDDRALRPEAVGGELALRRRGLRAPDRAPGLQVPVDAPRGGLARRLRRGAGPAHARGVPRGVRQLDVALLVPVLFGVDLLGVIAVGRKLSGERFGPDDRQLLLTLANQSSIAIENAQGLRRDRQAQRDARGARRGAHPRAARHPGAAHAEREDAHAGPARRRRRPRAEQPDRLRARQPQAARGVRREARARSRSAATTRASVREAIAKLLSRSREGTERVKQIVADLRTFSRMDQGELQEADLNEEIERTIALMEPRAGSAGSRWSATSASSRGCAATPASSTRRS
jgi:signal transduction histidine kinase